MKIDRLIAIVIYLLNKDLVPASELAQRFSVSIRTIQRDLETLNLAGIPVYKQVGKLGGYGILPEYKLNNRLISNEDFLNVLTALKSIQGTFADKRFLGSLEQIYSLVPSQIHEEVLERENTLFIDFSVNGDDSVLTEKIRTIEHAITRRLCLEFNYTNNKQETLARIIEPMTLILQWGSWYLYAYCCTRADFRLFKVSRMHEVIVTIRHFLRREKTYQEFRSERPTFQNSNLINLVFIADPSVRAIIEESHPPHELDYKEDGSIVVRCKQPEEERLYRYLLSYAGLIKILEPEHVKERVLDIAKRVLING
ncbi:MAG: YafY family transcriptional regulator [Chloroflexi bacterium HGW-Chloroflexi-5]|jgi:predicted DNA-binding transcriptional regulator YafY|nr:MAG: YafY family transcriptional regulator [Chloroflexi bacterium HGW-Chloroflexi-5]